MNSFKIKSYAKINLALNVTGKKSKLHNIESLISFIDLYDSITITESKTKKHKTNFIGKFSKNINKINTISKLLKILDNKKLLNMDVNSELYAEILYRRGGSYERSGDYIKADRDLLKSLEANPDDAYVLNYLAYSWLEREHKIDTALKMLEKAYAARSNDPYIIDSIGWAYYLVDEYEKAENFLKRAVELMPQDPIVNDHYGDILWQLDRKIQARYFWQAVLNLDETEDTMKETIKNKLIEGLKNS